MLLYRSVNQEMDAMDREKHSAGGMSRPVTIYSLVNTISGVGLLGLPFAVAHAGWVGLAYIVMGAVMANYTGMLEKFFTKGQDQSEHKTGELLF